MKPQLQSTALQAGSCSSCITRPAWLPLHGQHPSLPTFHTQQRQCSRNRRLEATPAVALTPPGTSYSNEQPELQAASTSRQDDDVLLEFRNVHKSFGSKPILRGASFKIWRGEAVGIIGSSGTGKSTTLRLAAGLLAPDKGEVVIKGHTRQGLLSDDDTSESLKVGLVFQSGALFDSLTVGENVGFLLHEHTKLSKEKIEALVAESLGKVGLSGVERLYPSELSGGMKKRVALARAIVRDEQHDDVEQLLLYDEPTAGLDPVASTVVEDLIRSLHSWPDPLTAPPGTLAAVASSSSSSSSSSSVGPLTSSSSGAAPSANASSSSSSSSSTGSGKDAAARLLPPPRRTGSGRPLEEGGLSSYIVVTHQHSTIRRTVDRLIFLHEGRVVWEGSVLEFDTTDEPIVRQFASGSLDGPIVYL